MRPQKRQRLFGVLKDIPFRMILRGLFNAFKRRHLGKNKVQQPRLIKKIKRMLRIVRTKHFIQLGEYPFD
jgi:hypothetical protein